ncbi:MAG TPA: DUF3187 family protein [Nevskiaceae bacterium]|nr:DUF3187 family protein [Nevskiaceae bacterium]
MSKSRWAVALLCGAVMLLPAASALAAGGDDAGFDTGFAVRNDSALSQVFALPPIGAPHVLAPGDGQFRADLDWTNEFVDQAAGSETLIEDGETQRYTLSLRRGFAGGPWGGYELGVSLPVIALNGGVLDGIIQNYHKLFGFPNGGRNLRPHDQVLYQYTRSGDTGLDTGLDMDSSHTGLGDMTLSAGVQARPGLALRAELKLPTGASRYLEGGNLGGAVWLDFDPFEYLPPSRWFGFLSLGGSYNQTSAVLPELQRHAILLGGLGAGFHVTQKFALLAQFYAHSPLWKHTEISALRKMGLQGAFGGRYAFSRHLAFEAGFQEDLVTDSSPDFSIHLGAIVR